MRIHHAHIDVIKDSSGVRSIKMPWMSNFHAHLRDGPLMRAIAYQTLLPFKYVLIMPNTGPIDTVAKVRAYHKRLQRLVDECGLSTQLVMTIYFTDKLTPTVVEELAQLPFPCAVKYYPPTKGATTGSGYGIPLSEMHKTLQAMQVHGVRLLGHFESTHDRNGRELPMVEREGYFMGHEFGWLREEFPELLINIEHATTRKAIEWVTADESGRTTCGITPQAMLFTTADLEHKAHSWANHLKCMPYAKSEDDRQAVAAFATSGDRRAHLGDDTAAHLSRNKVNMSLEEAACGCYLPHSPGLYAYAFAKAGALNERFVQFACFNGPDTWGLPRPDFSERMILRRETERDIPDPTPVPEEDDVVIPLGWSDKGDPLEIGYALACMVR